MNRVVWVREGWNVFKEVGTRMKRKGPKWKTLEMYYEGNKNEKDKCTDQVWSGVDGHCVRTQF